MQTFLPFPSYEQSAESLDYRRLGKQRVETKQILLALGGRSKGWVNHPATKMWRGHEIELCNYGLAMSKHWVERGYNDSLGAQFLGMRDEFANEGRDPSPPDWLGAEEFHASHRSNLLRKFPEFYGKFGWAESPDLPYVWPVAT